MLITRVIYVFLTLILYIRRLLKVIYRPHNIYCIHVDAKSSDTFKRAVASIVACFDNVFITNQQESIVYAGINRLLADIHCFRNILELTSSSLHVSAEHSFNYSFHANFKGKSLNPDWKYMLNLASSEFPLRTNYELARIFNMYNGTNEIPMWPNFDRQRVDFVWEVRNGSMKRTERRKSSPPHGYTIYKGLVYCVLSRAFVTYALTDKHAIDLLEWGADTYSPDEWSIFFFFYLTND